MNNIQNIFFDTANYGFIFVQILDNLDNGGDV